LIRRIECRIFLPAKGFLPLDILHPDIPQKLRDARRSRGLTQAALAQLVGCQQSAVSMMESGRMSALAQETIIKIASELNVVLTSTSAPSTLSVPAPLRGVAFCPDPGCPSNVPFVVNGILVFWPYPQPAHAAGGHCMHCGEVLSHVCEKCGLPAAPGACCRHCGAAYIAPPAIPVSDPDAWALARRQQIAEWRALLR